jgi:CheY-like chemotaxis protein
MTKQILVVDDDPLTAKLMKGRLKAPGNPTDMRAAEAAEFIADRQRGSNSN